MASHPVPGIPLRASDQADVIRIFIELMRERDRAMRVSEVSLNQPLPQRSHPGLSWFPGKRPDFE